MCAGELAERLDIAKPTLSSHFNVLKGANLVTNERNGTTIVYHLNMSVLEEAMAALLDIAASKRRPRGPA